MALPKYSDLPEDVQESIKASVAKLQKIHERLRDEAPLIEDAISELDKDVAKALQEDDSEDPFSRRIAYGTTLWAQHGW